MKLVEQVARAIYATDNGGIADRHPDGWIEWLPEARAALSVLAANVSDEMAHAAANHCGKRDPITVDEWRGCVSAALSAAGDEDRRA